MYLIFQWKTPGEQKGWGSIPVRVTKNQSFGKFIISIGLLLLLILKRYPTAKVKQTRMKKLKIDFLKQLKLAILSMGTV